MNLIQRYFRIPRLCLITLMAFFFLPNTQAQTDAMFTKYFFNSLVFNPGYAGSKGHMTMNAIHRTQWLGIQGAPQTQTLTIHSPLKFDRLALGGSLIHEQVGTTRAMTANMAYAYRIRMGKSKFAGQLAVGIHGGVTNWRTDLSQTELFDLSDDAFSEPRPVHWLPNFGFGLHYYSDYYFIGVSSPNLMEYDLRNLNINTERYARTTRHYYLMAGGAIPLGGRHLVLRPMLLFKNAGFLSKFKNEDDPFRTYGSPIEFNADLSLFIRETLWVGASFRSAVEAFDGSSSFDSASIWATYYIKKRLSIGVAYDYSLTAIQQPAKASFEVMVGYELNYSTSRAYSPRYF